MSPRIACLPLLLAPLLATAEPYTAIKDGERFVFKAGWGIFSKAGEIVVEAKKAELDGRPVMRVAMTTTTRGVVSTFYQYKEVAEAVIDFETGRLLVATDKAETTKPLSDAVTRFDYASRTYTHVDPLRPGRNNAAVFPGGDPIDLISALVQTREWADRTGLQRDVLVFAGREVYPITLRSEGVEEVTVGRRSYSALRLVPRMEKDEPRGVFKKGGEISVWVSQENERLPVRMQLSLKIGTATLTLIEHATLEKGARQLGR